MAIFAAALTLRPQIGAVGPLLPRIQAELGVAFSVVGLLGTIPIICMGVVSPLTPAIASRLGARRAATACLVVIGAAGLARAAAPEIFSLLAVTVVAGIAMGIGGALLPVAVKNRLPHRPLLGSGVYVAGIQLGAALSALAAVPLAVRLGGWRPALAAISAASLVLAGMWWLLRRNEPEPATDGRIPRLPWSSGLAWTVALTFGVISSNYHGFIAWLPSYLIEQGWDESPAGNALALVSITALAATVLLPIIADRRGSRRMYLAAAGGMIVVGLTGLLTIPAASWLWVAIIGFGQGIQFLIVLVLPLDVADRPEATGAVAGFMLGAGFLMAAPAPSLLGAARDVTGTFATPMWILVATGVLLMMLAAVLSPKRLGAGVSVPAR